MTSTTNNGATVDNLNVLDTITADNTGGAEIIELQDIANALFPSTNATQTITIDNTFWSGNLSLTFQAAGSHLYYTLKATALESFTLVQSDQYGNAISGATPVTFSANSASAFLSAFSTNLQLISSGLSSTSLLTALDITGGVGKNVFQATLNGEIANIFSYASATDSFNGTGSQWDVINNFNEGVDKLDFTKLLIDAYANGNTASSNGLAEFIWMGLKPANTTSLGATGAFAVWYTTDGSGGSFVYADTNGDGVADLKIEVAGVPTLTPNDFFGVDPPSAFTVSINPIEPSQSNQWLINASDASAGVTVTGTVSGFTPSAHLTVTLNGQSYTATVFSNGTWSASISSSNISHASLPDGTYTLAATVKVGNSTQATASHPVTVDETAPVVTWAADTPGVEGAAITLGTLAASDGDGISSLAVSGIPLGAILSDILHSFAASSGNTSIDIHAWALSSLKITPINDTNFSLAAVATDAAGNSNTAVMELVTVNPLAPTVAPGAETGVEGSAIALSLGVAVRSLGSESNSLSSLLISGATAGAVLTDGTNSHTFSGPSDAFDIHSWNLSTLTIKPANDTNFTLTVAATEKDGEGNLSTTTTSTEAVTVNPLTPTVTISGTAQESQTLTAHVTTTDTNITTAYQWQSSSDGTTWSNITGATNSTYVIQETDEKNYFRVIATETDPEHNSTSGTSPATSAVLDAAPTVTTPLIAGTAQEGQTLTASASAGQSDNGVTYQWFSSADGFTHPIGTGATYMVQEGDEGAQIEVVATTTNDNGVTIAKTSAATSAVLDAAPTVTTPLISGTAQEGQTLTASASAGQSDNAVTYQWFSSADGFTNPIGTGATYVVPEADEGTKIEVVATATNENGVTISTTSAATSAVLDAAPTVTTPLISGTAQEGQTLTASASSGQSDNGVTYQWFSSADGFSNPTARARPMWSARATRPPDPGRGDRHQ